MFNEVEIDMIKTSAAVINAASWKLMEKLGMVRVGEGESPYIDDDGNRIPSYMYELTRDKYLDIDK